MVAEQNIPHDDVAIADSYKKIDHGRQIVEWMCEHGESVDEIGEFLDYCVEQSQA